MGGCRVAGMSVGVVRVGVCWLVGGFGWSSLLSRRGWRSGLPMRVERCGIPGWSSVGSIAAGVRG